MQTLRPMQTLRVLQTPGQGQHCLVLGAHMDGGAALDAWHPSCAEI